MPSKISSIKTANKIKDKYLKIRQEKNKKLTDQHKIDKLIKVIDAITDVNKSSEKKQNKIAAEKILKKYRSLKKPKKTYLVSEKDIKTIDYLLPDEDIYAGESIVNTANKVFNFDQFKKEQAREIVMYNEQLLNETAETINYVDDMDINDLKENKKPGNCCKKK